MTIKAQEGMDYRAAWYEAQNRLLEQSREIGRLRDLIRELTCPGCDEGVKHDCPLERL